MIGGFPNTKSGTMKAGQKRKVSKGKGGYHNNFPDEATENDTYGDDGSAARFFYCAKASKAERNKGCEGMEAKELRHGDGRGGSHEVFNTKSDNRPTPTNPKRTNHHPTVKPISLMRYLCRLTRMPEGGTVLDPFMGSGSTGVACKMENRDFIGIDLSPEYCEIAKNRIEAWEPEVDEDDGQMELPFDNTKPA